MRHPLRTGAILPSGRKLADVITGSLHGADQTVLELGPGTGSFTKAILSRGVCPGNVTVVEVHPDLASRLGRRYPEIRVINADASALAEHMPSAGYYSVAISGLPFVSFEAKKRRDILCAIFSGLAQGGALFQFTYLPKPPVDRKTMDSLGLDAELVGVVWNNVPPAWVYRIGARRTAQAPGAS
ncbi:MAG: methyltransferase domain-containing protein [Proteobacteria bacterium]|nr:methyltransferase domain-containing protein [Pseudomonadota bacterium]